MAENLYLLADKNDVPVGRGRIQSELDAPQLRLRVLDGDIDVIGELDLIKLVGFAQDVPSMQGTVVRCTGDSVILGNIAKGAAIRETLRVKVSFETLIYPLNDIFRGRRKVEFIDLSCGGIAFYCDEAMAVGDRIEVVLPVSSQPLVLRAQILRVKNTDRTIYAAKFIDLCYEEEKMICEAVFGIQLKQHKQMDQ